jgi:hypothetical protein
MSQASQIRDLIRQNYTAAGEKLLSWPDFAKRHDFNLNNVHAQVRYLRKAGLLPETVAQQMRRFSQSRAWAQKHGGVPSVPSPPPRSAPEASLSVLDGITSLPGSMTREERIKQLSTIARSGSELGSISAMKHLEEMERQAGTSYGPPPPTTKKDTIALLVELLKSTKPDWAAAAIEAYINEQTEEQSPEKQAESDGTTPSPSDLEGR